MSSYIPVIGLEVHAELLTKSKVFCTCNAEFGGDPNSRCCPVCTGMPGTLPVINQTAVEYAVKAGFALGCDINKFSVFDRKNYFYPDLPKAYQISQLNLPLCINGVVTIEVDGKKKDIRVNRIHLEEDAGKLVHDDFNAVSLADYNRCGVPLIEIVTEPDISSAEEAKAFVEKVSLLLQYAGVCDCKMEQGSLRADVNVSIMRPEDKEFGTRTEMKNLNSFKAIGRAIEGERARQIELLEEGKKVIQETRRWDDNKEYSYPMRSKEDAHDYRYFPDPDLVPVIISDEWLQEVRDRQPELRTEKLERYKKEFDIPAYDADILTGSKRLADLFEETTALCGKPKKVSNWLMGETLRLLKEEGKEPEDLSFTPQHLASLIELLDAGTINQTVAKEVFEKIYYEDVDPQVYVEEHGLKMVNDDNLLRTVVEGVIAANPQSVADYKGGKEKALGFLVGQTMKQMKGKANPGAVNKMLKELL